MDGVLSSAPSFVRQSARRNELKEKVLGEINPDEKWRARHAGRVKKNVAPWSSWDSTQIRPPCRSTIFLLMAKPIPLPGYSVRVCKR